MVPQDSAEYEFSVLLLIVAIPKSVNLTYPLVSNNKFSGFRSL